MKTKRKSAEEPTKDIHEKRLKTPSKLDQIWDELDKSNWKYEVRDSEDGFTQNHKIDSLALLAAQTCPYGCQIAISDISVSNKSGYATYTLCTTEDDESQRNIFKIDLRFKGYGIDSVSAMEMYEEQPECPEDWEYEYEEPGFQAFQKSLYEEQESFMNQLIQEDGFELCQYVVRGKSTNSDPCEYQNDVIKDATDSGRMQGTIEMIQKGANFIPICDDGLPGFDFSTDKPKNEQHTALNMINKPW